MVDQKQAEQATEGLSAEYANNTLFDPSIWDLKILFGELSPVVGESKGVVWHTAITLPWAQAKLMSYYLQANIAIYEAKHGPIGISPVVIPPEPPPLPPEERSNAESQALFELITEDRRRFVESLKPGPD